MFASQSNFINGTSEIESISSLSSNPKKVLFYKKSSKIYITLHKYIKYIVFVI